VLLIGTIIPSSDPARQARNDKYNAELEDMVSTRRSRGQKFIQMYMDKAVKPDQLIDGIHPTDEGYHNIALHWLQGVDQAEELEWIEPPEVSENFELMIILVLIFGFVLILAVGAPVYICCRRR
jgi:hypothetical protein